MREIRRLTWLLLAALLLAGCAGNKKASALQRQQYAWSAAIRWGDFEGAWNLVDPEYREANPMTELHFERYGHIQISAYRERGVQAADEGTVVRDIEIGVVNRHTMAERSLRHTEQWRYDPDAGQWWIANGLPDFWRGE
ncbi:hypothetical protein H0E84_00250 [Luteimonas sp. SJ-92]|uniref:Lipoprotein n=2 Tax=Luteimonas salinisoli TaxID=2752307 RepID=A0A853J6T8_9GAMM|nr:hypothetical protein [Luteimonas salinisoli]